VHKGKGRTEEGIVDLGFQIADCTDSITAENAERTQVKEHQGIRGAGRRISGKQEIRGQGRRTMDDRRSKVHKRLGIFVERGSLGWSLPSYAGTGLVGKERVSAS